MTANDDGSGVYIGRKICTKFNLFCTSIFPAEGQARTRLDFNVDFLKFFSGGIALDPILGRGYGALPQTQTPSPTRRSGASCLPRLARDPRKQEIFAPACIIYIRSESSNRLVPVALYRQIIVLS